MLFDHNSSSNRLAFCISGGTDEQRLEQLYDLLKTFNTGNREAQFSPNANAALLKKMGVSGTECKAEKIEDPILLLIEPKGLERTHLTDALIRSDALIRDLAIKQGRMITLDTPAPTQSLPCNK